MDNEQKAAAPVWAVIRASAKRLAHWPSGPSLAEAVGTACYR